MKYLLTLVFILSLGVAFLYQPTVAARTPQELNLSATGLTTLGGTPVYTQPAGTITLSGTELLSR